MIDLAATSLLACEPIPVLSQLFGGPNFFAVFSTQSFGLLCFVVAVKVAFFAWLMRNTVSWGAAAGAMLLGNVVSTLVGLFVAALIATPAVFMPFGLIAVGVAAHLAAKNIREPLAATPLRPIIRYFVPLSVLLVFASVIVAGPMMMVQPDLEPAVYWPAKLGAVFCVVCASLILTVLWEANTAMQVLSGSAPEEASEEERSKRSALMQAIARATLAANLWTFFWGFLLAAAMTLPERFRNPGWLYLGPGR